MMDKKIGGISIERWKRAFAAAAETAINEGYLDDTLYHNFYPDTSEIAAGIEDEEAQCDIYNEKMDFAAEAFKEIFNVNLWDSWDI